MEDIVTESLSNASTRKVCVRTVRVDADAKGVRRECPPDSDDIRNSKTAQAIIATSANISPRFYKHRVQNSGDLEMGDKYSEPRHTSIHASPSRTPLSRASTSALTKRVAIWPCGATILSPLSHMLHMCCRTVVRLHSSL